MLPPQREPKELRVDVLNHFVCLIDLLGQQSHLERWEVVPEDDILPESMQRAIHQTAGAVHWFRGFFESTFAQFNVPTISAQELQRAPAMTRESYLRIRDSKLKSQQFADTFVFYAPAESALREATALPLLGIVAACSLSMICSLASGVPFRGAIAFGAGLELSERNFYGPSLAVAHRLESVEADYPRIVVSSQVIDWIDRALIAPPPQSENLQLAWKILTPTATLCRSLLRQDSDGMWIVDYAGAAARSFYKKLPLEVDVQIHAAHKFAIAERARLATCDKLGPRYVKLCDYFERSAKS